MKKSIRFNILLREEPEGGFTVTVPALPGCVTFGKTLQEAQSMAEDAIRAYLESCQKHNQEMPAEDNCYITNLEVIYA